MALVCVVTGCNNSSDNYTKKSFYEIPPLVQGKDEKTKLLSQLRRDSWISTLVHCDLKPKDLDSYRICSDHFSLGRLF